MIQLGIRLHDTAELPFEERLETVRAQGFSCVHLALSKVSGLPSAPEAFTPGYAMALRHLFAKHELDVAVLGCYQNPGNPDEQMMARIRNQYLAHIRPPPAVTRIDSHSLPPLPLLANNRRNPWYNQTPPPSPHIPDRRSQKNSCNRSVLKTGR